MKKLTRRKLGAGGWVGGHQRISQGLTVGSVLGNVSFTDCTMKAIILGKKVMMTQVTRRIILKIGVLFRRNGVSTRVGKVQGG